MPTFAQMDFDKEHQECPDCGGSFLNTGMIEPQPHFRFDATDPADAPVCRAELD